MVTLNDLDCSDDFQKLGITDSEEQHGILTVLFALAEIGIEYYNYKKLK